MIKAREMEAASEKKNGTGAKGNAAAKQTSSEKSTVKKSSAQLAAELYEKYSPEKTAERQQKMSSWADKYNSTMQALSDYDTKRDGAYTKDVSGGQLSKVEELLREYSEFGEFASRAGFPNADRYYRKLMKARDNILKQNQYMASFESEESYNAERRRGQWAEKYQGKSAEELTSMLEDLTDEEEKEWLKSYSDSVGYQERMTFDTKAGQTAVEEMAQAYADAAASQKEYENYLSNPILAMTDSTGFQKAREAVLQVRKQYGNLKGMEAALQKKREQLAAARQTQQAAVDMKQHEEYLKTVRKSGQIRPELEAARQNVEKLKPFRVAGNDALNQSLKGKLEAAEADLAKLEKEYYYSQLQEYNALKEREDFAEKSRYVSTHMDNPMAERLVGVFNGDLDYEYVNRNRAAFEFQSKADRESGAAQWGGDQSQRLQMTDEEIGIYNYLHATQGAEKAREYLDFLNSDLNSRRRQQDENAFRTLADSGVAGAVAASAMSVGMAPLKGMGYIGQGVDYLLNGKVDENAQYNKFSHASSAIRDQVAKKIEQSGHWGQVGSFAYQTAMSMADFLYSSTFAKGSQALSLAIMGSGAAADTTVSAKDRGLDDRQAFQLGTVAGIAEALTEMFSLEALLDPDMLKNGIARYVVKNVIAEGSEEVASSVINLIADVVIAGDRNQMRQSINSYIQQGYSEGEAFGRAVADQAASLGMDFLGGAISGGILAGAYGGMTYRNQKRLGTAINNMGNLEGENLQKTLKESMGAEQGTTAREVAKQLQDKLDQGRTLSAADKGRLLQADPKNVAKAAIGEGKVRLANPMVQGIDNTSVKWQQAERLSAMTGKTVLFYNGAAVENGKFDRDSGAIYVNVNGRDPVHQVFSHELTHSMETVGAYTELADVIKQRLKTEGKDLDQMRKAIRDLYSKHGHDLKTNEQVDAEIVADYVAENLLTNEAAILEVVAAKPTLGQKILNWIDGVLAKMGNKNAAERKFLADARAIYAKALNQSRSGENKNAPAASQSEAVQNPEQSRKQEQRDADLREGRITEEEWNEQWDADHEQDNLDGYLEENAQYSIARTKDMPYEQQMDRYFAKQDALGRSNDIAIMGVDLSTWGLENKPIFMKKSNLKKSVRKEGNNAHYSAHGISEETIRKLPEHLRNPGLVVVVNSRLSIIADEMVQGKYDEQAPLLIGIDTSSSVDGKPAYEIKSIYGVDNFANWLALRAKEGKVLAGNEEKAAALLRRAGVQFPRAMQKAADLSEIILAQEKESVKQTGAEEQTAVSIDPQTGGATYSQNGEPVAYSHGNGTAQFSLSKEEDYRNEQGYYVEDQIQDNARKAGYPVLKGEQVIPFRTWVRAEDRRNYGLVVGLAGPNALRVNFTNKDEGYNKTVTVANSLLTPVPGVHQMTKEEYASLMQQAPEAPGSHPLTPEEQQDVEELLERAGAWMDDGRKGITEEAQAAKMNRDKLPGKAKTALQRAESKLIRQIGRSLNIPWHQQWNGLKDSVMEMTGEYLQTGTISDETIGRIFDAAYEGSMQRKLDYLEQYKELGAFLKKTAITVSEGVHAYDYFAKSYRNLRLAEKGGMKLDEAYAKAHEMAPELFPEKITDPEDKLRRLNQLLWDMDVAIRDLGAHHGTNPEDFKKWARHEFETAIWDNVQDLSRAKQYAYEKGRKKENRKVLTAEDAEKYFEQRKQLRRDVERVTARHMLTENEELLLGRMLRGEISREQLDPDEVNVDGIMAVYKAKVDYEALDDILREYKRSIQAKRRETADEMLKTAGRWKDKKSGFLYARETMRRNILDIVPDRQLAESIIEHYFESIHKSEAASTKFKTEFRDRVRELNLNTKVEKGNLVSEAHAVQLLGEALDNIRVLEKSRGRMTQRDGKTHEEWVGVIQNLWKENPNLNVSKIENAVDEFRKIYDQLFQQMNKVRVANGYEPVNYRHGYFPHFQPGDGDGVMAYFGKILGIDIQVDALPTTINGLSHTFKPGIQWFGNAQERLGFNTAYDAVQGFDKYIEGVASVIFQTENIQNLRALATQVRYRTSPLGLQEQVDRVRMNDDMTEEEKDSRIKELMTDGKFGLNNFAVELDEYTNLLANKKSRYDRTMEGLIGRRAYTLMKTWENQIGANMIAGNISSALTNFIPLTQAGAQLDTGMILRGVWDTLKNIKVNDGLVGMSDFLTNRRGSDPLVKTWIQKASGVMGTPMELIDNFTSEAIVRAAYTQNLKRGMTAAEALHQADIFAANVMADRSKGSMPTLFESRNPLFKALTQFQLEVNNQVSEVFKDLPRNFRGASSGEKKKELAVLAGILLKYFLGAMLYNELYEKLVGRRPAMDPFGILVNAADTWKEEGLGAAGAQLFEETAQSVPFVGGLLGGGRLPVNGAIPDLGALWEATTTEDMAPEKRWKEIQDELNKLAYVLPPFGGAQISKIWKGTEALIKGGSYSVNNEGREILQYPVFKDDPYEALGNALRMSVLGKNSIKTAQDWAKSGYKSLNAEETAMYKDMLESGVKDRTAFEMIWKVKNTEAPAGTAQQEKAAVERKLKKDMILKSGLSKEGKAILYYGMAATDTERKWLDSLTDAGADQAESVGFVHDLYEAGDLKGVDKKIRYAEIFDVAPLTEDEKQFAMQFVLGTKRENDNGNLTQYGKFLTAMEMGLSVDTYMEMYSNEANVDEFFEMHDAGVSLDAAADLSVKLSKLEPLDGEEKVSWYQECDVILKSKLSNADQVAALQVVSYEATGAKIRIGYENGLAPGALVYLKQILPKFDENGNGSYSQKEVQAAIDAVCGDDNVLYALTGNTPHGFTLTNDQKAILWQLQCNGKKNPYNQAVGDRIYQQWKAASEKDEGQQEESTQGTTSFQIRLK